MASRATSTRRWALSGPSGLSAATLQASVAPSHLRGEPVVDPGAKALDVVRRPRSVARHGAVGEAPVDALGVGAYVVIGRQVEEPPSFRRASYGRPTWRMASANAPGASCGCGRCRPRSSGQCRCCDHHRPRRIGAARRPRPCHGGPALHLVSVVDLDAALGEHSSTSRWDNPKRRYRPTARTMTSGETHRGARRQAHPRVRSFMAWSQAAWPSPSASASMPHLMVTVRPWCSHSL
jgi:hypothetical protein